MSQEGVAKPLKSAAALQLRAEVRQRWSASAVEGAEPVAAVYSDAQKAAVRAGLMQVLAALGTADVQLRRMMEEVVYQVVLQDYPRQWPECGGLVIQCLSQRENVGALLAGLSVLRRICKKFELSLAVDGEEALQPLIQQAGPLMLRCSKCTAGIHWNKHTDMQIYIQTY